jgi:signal peptidase II
MKNPVGKYALIVVLLVAGLCADMFSKKWANQTRRAAPVLTAVPGLVELGFIENRGMVFGILNRSDNPRRFLSFVTWVRVAVCIAVSCFIVMKRGMPLFFLLPLLFIWMGAIGNLIDIFTRGYVVDFIHIHLWKILDWPFFFNGADAYVCIGAGLLFLNGIFNPEKPKPGTVPTNDFSPQI